MEKKIMSPAVKGLIISLILIVFALAIQFLGLSRNKGLNSIQSIVFFAGVVWSAIYYAKQLNGNVTYGNAFAHAFKTAAAITAIMVVFSIITIKFISPEVMDMAIDEARTNMEAKNMSDDQIDTAINFTKKFFLPLTAAGVLFIYLLIGVIAALIGAAIAKKNPQGPFVQQPGQ